ncbi:related to cupin domain protein [Cephalotrichum gorgonifer]|uniref:Related to cupin domain protein n=1 Tax=Cephalotrichum gorgonifer TaxID=2041049 RepID=A0AAE8MPY6_9PEZI|nr:related to cupin domain protein [Cephalotrichum gorgonifer]
MATTVTRPREDIKVLFDYELPNAPGKSIIGLQLDYPPNGFTPPHRHGGASVVALVLEGELLSGMNGNPPQVYTPGEAFLERPGCHHTVGENNSPVEAAKAIAVFVVDTEIVKSGGYAALTVLDAD